VGFIAHFRGRLPEYAGPFHESMLLHEVTLEEFLAERYPPFLLQRFPGQARADLAKEQTAIQAATVPGDTLWL
jgi:hypothetical protein